MRIALIGFGEVGHILAQDLAGHELSVFDILFADHHSWPFVSAGALGLHPAASATEAVKGAELIISAVTAANDLQAAESVAPGLEKGAVFLDLNSASPGLKQAAGQAIEAAGGRYVEAAVMSPIMPKRITAPILLGGLHAAEFQPMLAEIGFTGAEVYSDKVGPASATKMCRSVMIKGVEALVTESMLAAREYGVEKTVLDSLSNLLPADDWEKLAQYMIGRSLEHGVRRAEEMREAAKTVEEAGIEPLMSRAIAERQDWAAKHKDALGEEDLGAMLDKVRGGKS